MAKYKSVINLIEHLFDASQQCLLNDGQKPVLTYGQLAVFLVKQWEFKNVGELSALLSRMDKGFIYKVVASNKKSFKHLKDRLENEKATKRLENIVNLVLMAKLGIEVAIAYQNADEPL